MIFTGSAAILTEPAISLRITSHRIAPHRTDLPDFLASPLRRARTAFCPSPPPSSSLTHAHTPVNPRSFFPSYSHTSLSPSSAVQHRRSCIHSRLIRRSGRSDPHIHGQLHRLEHSVDLAPPSVVPATFCISTRHTADCHRIIALHRSRYLNLHSDDNDPQSPPALRSSRCSLKRARRTRSLPPSKLVLWPSSPSVYKCVYRACRHQPRIAPSRILARTAASISAYISPSDLSRPSSLFAHSAPFVCPSNYRGRHVEIGTARLVGIFDPQPRQPLEPLERPPSIHHGRRCRHHRFHLQR